MPEPRAGNIHDLLQYSSSSDFCHHCPPQKRKMENPPWAARAAARRRATSLMAAAVSFSSLSLFLQRLQSKGLSPATVASWAPWTTGLTCEELRWGGERSATTNHPPPQWSPPPKSPPKKCGGKNFKTKNTRRKIWRGKSYKVWYCTHPTPACLWPQLPKYPTITPTGFLGEVKKMIKLWYTGRPKELLFSLFVLVFLCILCLKTATCSTYWWGKGSLKKREKTNKN